MINKLKYKVDKSIIRFVKDIDKKYCLKSISPLLYSGIKDFLLRNGKRIRPVMFLLSYAGYSSRRNPFCNNTLRTSIAFELLHDFLLVHDDIIDKSATRRGKPTLHRIYNKDLCVSPDTGEPGVGLGIVAGDIIFALSIELFNSFPGDQGKKKKALEKFIESTVLTGAGEFIDVLKGEEGIHKVSESDINKIHIYKTARYTFETPLVIGALLAGAGKSEIKKVSELGIILGQAFQIVDDLLDVFSKEKTIGKPVLSDIKEGKKTLLAVMAYKNLKGKDKAEFRKLFNNRTKTDKQVKNIKKLMKRSGSAEYCIKRSRHLLGKADVVIDKLNMNDRFLQGIKDMKGDLSNRLDFLLQQIDI